MTELDTDALAKLRKPFPAEQIGKLPKGGIWLDFIGHGYITARFLDSDPAWNWRPMAFDDRGLPLFDEHGGLWMYLSIGGVERIAYGDAGGKKGPNAIKEAIGDALRNGGMRFGAGLELWCKGDPDAQHAPAPEPVIDPASLARVELKKVCESGGLDLNAIAKRFEKDHGYTLSTADAETIEAFTAVISGEVAAR